MLYRIIKYFFYIQSGFFIISNGIFKFNFLAVVVSEISKGPQIVQLPP